MSDEQLMLERLERIEKALLGIATGLWLSPSSHHAEAAYGQVRKNLNEPLLTEQPEQDEAGERELIFLREHHAVTETAIGAAKMLLKDNRPDQALDWLKRACAKIEAATVKYQPATARALGLAPEPELCTHPDCDCVDAETECPKGLKTLAPEPVEQLTPEQRETMNFLTRIANLEHLPKLAEPAAPQPECETAEEKLARLEGLVGSAIKADFVSESAFRREFAKLRDYHTELAAERPTPDTEREEQR